MIRRNELDVVNIYDTFSNLMRISTCGSLLNFGYWTDKTNNPLQAQIKLTTILGEYGCFENSKTILDVGSGFSVPALHWISSYSNPKIFCLNISLSQLKKSNRAITMDEITDYNGKLKSNSIPNLQDRIFHINSTSTMLPFKSNSMDRVVAFESAQHFKPLQQFVLESRRILKKSGLLIIAMPILRDKSTSFSFLQWAHLGILSITWASEHYSVELVTSLLNQNGFEIINLDYIGPRVYVPLADYYIKNRKELRAKIIKEYPKFLESILYRSITKMKNASESHIIDYIFLKASKE